MSTCSEFVAACSIAVYWLLYFLHEWLTKTPPIDLLLGFGVDRKCLLFLKFGNKINVTVHLRWCRWCIHGITSSTGEFSLVTIPTCTEYMNMHQYYVIFFFFFKLNSSQNYFNSQKCGKEKLQQQYFLENIFIMAVPAVGRTLTAVQHLVSRGCADTEKKKENIIRCSEICWHVQVKTFLLSRLEPTKRLFLTASQRGHSNRAPYLVRRC